MHQSAAIPAVPIPPRANPRALPYLPVYNACPCVIRTLFLDYDFEKKINKRKEEVQ